MLNLNPYVYQTKGDLSKADVVVLTLLCRGKRVVEYGVGGSTILLSNIAKSVVSYDTDPAWIEKIKPQAPNVEYRLLEKTPQKIEGFECDVLFDDGWSVLRDQFLLGFWHYIKDCAILHDGRMTYAGNCVKKFLDAFVVKNGENKLPDNPYTGSLKSIDWNWLESNMVVLHKRNCTLKYEDWKKTENG